MPQVFLVEHGANHVARAHSHTEDEVIFVLEGEMWVGDQHCPAGTAIYMEKDTVYGPLATKEKPVKFLNVRQRKAGVTITR